MYPFVCVFLLGLCLYVKDVENYVDRLGDKRSADEIEHHFSIVINELLPLYAEIAVRIKKWFNYDPTVEKCRQSIFV